MTDRKRQAAAWAVQVGVMAVFALFVMSVEAPAEDTGGFPGFLMHLFGGSQPAQKPEPSRTPARETHHVKAKKPKDFVPATTTRAPGAPGGAPVQAKFFVDVLGDSLADSASDGLTEAFAEKPEIGVVDKAHDASGLVRDDYFDWPKAAEEIANPKEGKDRPDFVVVMLGINDLQALRDGADSLDPLTPKWKEKYGQRADAMLAPFRAAHIPVLWVGLPPMRSDRVNAEAVALNEIFRAHAEKGGAQYVDIWDAFADQSGQYDAFGPNVEGQSVKLRGPDGIHFTKAGGRKVAHFLEAEIRHAFEQKNPTPEVATLPPDIEQAADDINSQIRREMGAAAPSASPGSGPGVPASAPEPPPKPLAGPILSLTAHPVSPGGALAPQNGLAADSPDMARVFRKGSPEDPVTGRADDFSWPRL